jgi:dTDP-4-dehydrorhamnose 3,5-epimerase
MDVIAAALPEVKIFAPTRRRDRRGLFAEIWSRRGLTAFGIHADLVQENHVVSDGPYTLRGLHFQVPPFAQGKLVRVIAGAIFDVAVDIRHGSPSFGRHSAVILSRAQWNQVWIPPGFAHGYLTLEPDTEVLYAVSEAYAPDYERGIAWDDPALAIPWPLDGRAPTLSPRDCDLPVLADCEPFFRHGGEA